MVLNRTKRILTDRDLYRYLSDRNRLSERALLASGAPWPSATVIFLLHDRAEDPPALSHASRLQRPSCCQT